MELTMNDLNQTVGVQHSEISEREKQLEEKLAVGCC
jgi:hypothetical protein